MSLEEVDSLLQKHAAEDCVTDALHAARQDLRERGSPVAGRSLATSSFLAAYDKATPPKVTTTMLMPN